MSGRLLQTNLNHAARAQLLLSQNMAAWMIDLAVVAEPYKVPTRGNWFGDTRGLVAIAGGSGQSCLPLALFKRGEGFVAVEWGEVVVVGTYFSPNGNRADFEELLERVGAVITAASPRQVIVAGDLNAKSHAWGSPVTNIRGRILESWVMGAGLRVVNRGTASTCVRPTGESIVDVMFATPVEARRIRHWRVLEGEETMSDHQYIRCEVSDPSEGAREAAHCLVRGPPTRKWAVKRRNEDLLKAAAIAAAWGKEDCPPPTSAEEGATKIRDILWDISDASMPKSRLPKRQTAAYWWNDRCQEAHSECNRLRRSFKRLRRRGHWEEEEEVALRHTYVLAKDRLSRAIWDSRQDSWNGLLEALDRDPWGRAYHIVRKRMNAGGPPVTESLPPVKLEEVMAALFPRPEERGNPPAPLVPPVVDWDEERDGVKEYEILNAIKRLGGKTTAPGPDGIHGKVLAVAAGPLWRELCRLFSTCLREGVYPREWKKGRVVLIPKPGKAEGTPSAYRPIVVLSEVGKIFEQIILARMNAHLREVGPNLASCQFGFREGRSTIDAIKHVKALTERAVARGKVMLAVSLDIANAFNSLPWAAIRGALEWHGFPPYIQRIVGNYLQGRIITYPGRYRRTLEREVFCGVPQGSVLGPLLWNLAYDPVLRAGRLPGMDIVCYADDTLVLARGKDWGEATRIAEVGTALTIGRIEALGLRVAVAKTQVLWFGPVRSRGPPRPHVEIVGARLEVGEEMKYLGLHLDPKWRFATHFSHTAEKVRKAAGAIICLMPNLRGPRDSARRLYLATMSAMALYGAPVWHGRLRACRASRTKFRQLQRWLATHAVRGYNSVAGEAACAVASFMPWTIAADMMARTYEGRVRRQEENPAATRRARLAANAAMRREERQSAVEEWQMALAEPTYGSRAIDAIRPILPEWVSRRHGGLTFWAVQIITDHGCFGKHLCTVQKEPTRECHHCGDDEDTAQHTLEYCPAWAEERRALVGGVGQDLSLPAVLARAVADPDAWESFTAFCGAVMSAKEDAERMREADPFSDRNIFQRRRAREREEQREREREEREREQRERDEAEREEEEESAGEEPWVLHRVEEYEQGEESEEESGGGESGGEGPGMGSLASESLDLDTGLDR